MYSASTAIFGGELFVQWCNRLFFSFHFLKKSENEMKEMLSCNFFMCMPNQNGNGRAELNNELYAKVAESNGNEFREWLEWQEREREKKWKFK